MGKPRRTWDTTARWIYNHAMNETKVKLNFVRSPSSERRARIECKAWAERRKDNRHLVRSGGGCKGETCTYGPNKAGGMTIAATVQKS